MFEGVPVRPSDVPSASLHEAGPTLARGTALGRFVVLGLVGRGAMGEVYGAYDPELDRKIAIKLLRAHADSSGDTPERRARLMREAQATAKISHPNVIVVYDAGTFGDRVFIAMEYVEGNTLRYWLQQQDRTWSEILQAFMAAGRGLAAAHERDFVHRDFKPDNVMVASNGQVRVMDFGLARLAGEELPVPLAVAAGELSPAVLAADRAIDLSATPILGAGETKLSETATIAFRDKITATGALLGTPAYMSPEQFQSQPADERSDQFSFCVALYEALYGARPFAGATLEDLASNVVAGKLAAPPAARRVPAWIHKVLERGLRPNPTERYATMDALLVDLDQAGRAGAKDFAAGAAAKLAGVWEAPVDGRPVETPHKEAIRQAFLATDKAYAAAAYAGASVVLDRFTQRWTELYIEVCEATHVRGEQSAEVLDLRMGVLTDGLDDLKALCRMFRSATADVVTNAVNAANNLGTLERCRDIKLLRALVKPPEDPTVRDAVDRVRERMVDLRAMVRVGNATQGLEVSGPLVEEARRVGYGPALAEVLFVHGTLQLNRVDMSVVAQTMEDAMWQAEAARHDEIAASAASHLIYVTGYVQGRFEVAEIWIRYTEAILNRMGPGHDQLWGWFYNNRGAVREQQGRLEEGIADCRRSIAAKERALGSEAPDIGNSLGNLANHLAHGADFTQALEISTRGLAILMKGLGPDHPMVALHLANRGQFLYRLGRFAEGEEATTRALATFEREYAQGILLTFPLRTLGLCQIGTGRFEEALNVLERAVKIREALEKRAVRLAEVHFALAQALRAAGREPDRALALARQARSEYEQAKMTPVAALDLAELDRWLAAAAG
jgi:tRNA A-37 threonylcarbamoyl transferase component Bud32/tetratricopeptide (TPR) repeat protein